MNTLERKLPIGIQTFEKMRAEGCLYVDKTAIIYQIVATKAVSYTHLTLPTTPYV